MALRSGLVKVEDYYHTARRELRAQSAQLRRRLLPCAAKRREISQGRAHRGESTLLQTHDLLLLLDSCLLVAPLLDAFRPSLAILKNFAVHIWFPGDDATHAVREARDVVRRAEAVRAAVRAHLGLHCIPIFLLVRSFGNRMIVRFSL